MLWNVPNQPPWGAGVRRHAPEQDRALVVLVVGDGVGHRRVLSRSGGRRRAHQHPPRGLRQAQRGAPGVILTRECGRLISVEPGRRFRRPRLVPAIGTLLAAPARILALPAGSRPRLTSQPATTGGSRCRVCLTGPGRAPSSSDVPLRRWPARVTITARWGRPPHKRLSPSSEGAGSAPRTGVPWEQFRGPTLSEAAVSPAE